jgi:hypothetical protein
MHAAGYEADGKCVNAADRGKLGDLLSMEHRQGASVFEELPGSEYVCYERKMKVVKDGCVCYNENSAPMPK